MEITLRLENIIGIISSVYSSSDRTTILDYNDSGEMAQTIVNGQVEKTYSISDLMCEDSKKSFFILDANQRTTKHWCTFVNKKGEKLENLRGSGINCWNDRHPFNTSPLGCPIKRLDKDIFKTVGIFCSFPCTKKFLKRRINKSKYKESPSLLSLIHLKVTGKVEEIPVAPSWKLLKIYGGHLSIEKYRESFGKLEFQSYKNNIPTMLPMNEIIKEKIVINRKSNSDSKGKEKEDYIYDVEENSD